MARAFFNSENVWPKIERNEEKNNTGLQVSTKAGTILSPEEQNSNPKK